MLIVLTGLAIRLGWVMTRPTDAASLAQLPDQREYLEVAQNLLQGNGLCFTDPRFNDRICAYRTPGYPIMLAAVGANVRAARVAQCLLDTSVMFATYLLARKWLSERGAILAAALVAFSPFLIYFSGLILTETLFTALLAWGMLLVLDRRTLPWLLGGVILALSILVRPGAIAIPVVLGLLGAISQKNAKHARWPLPVGATMVLLTVLLLLPWAYRNLRVVGEWVWTSTNGGITSYDGFNPDATGASDQTFVQAMPQLRGMSEIGRNHYLAEKAREYAWANPGRVWELTLAKLARTWSPRPLSNEFSRPLYVIGALAYSIPFDLLVIVGLCGIGLPRSAKMFLIAPALYLTLAAVASVGSLRYRIPAEVPLAIIAASAFVKPQMNADERELENAKIEDGG